MVQTSLVLAVYLLASSALSARPAFDPKDSPRHALASRQPHQTFDRGHPGLDDGEFLIDTFTTHALCPFDESAPAIAFDGTNFLLVWEDERNGNFDIYGCRVTPQGTVLDPAGIGIATPGHHQRQPAVAFDGANFLVVWTDAGAGPGNADIYGARVSREGAVLDPAGILIAGPSGNQVAPAVAIGSTSFLVVWEDARGGSDIYGCRVTPQGAVLDPSGIAISVAGSTQKSPAVAFGDEEFLVVWEDARTGNSDIYGCRVTPQGAAIDSSGIRVAGAQLAQTAAGVSSDGAEFLVVWEDGRNSASDIYGCRVAATGVALDTAGIAISTAAPDQHLPSVAFDGANFLCGFHAGDRSAIYGCRVTPQGEVLDTTLMPVANAVGTRESPAVGFGGTDYLAAWTDARGGDCDIYGCRVTPQGEVLDPDGLRLGYAAVCEGCPAASFDGANFLVAWEEYDPDSSWDICGARVTSDGTVLDTQGIPVSCRTGIQTAPAVAPAGENCLVVWTDAGSGPGAGDIIGTRVTPAGVVLDPDGLVISGAANAQYTPAVASDGVDYLVLWEDYRSGVSDIYGCRVTSSGQVLDPAGFALSTASGYQYWSALAFDGSNYLAVWTDQRGSYSDIYACRVTPSGAVLDPAGIAISTAAGYQSRPAISFDGTNYLVVWEDERDGPQTIYGCRVTPDGLALDVNGFSIGPPGVPQRHPALGFDGTDFLVLWANCHDGRPDIHGVRVTSDGTVHDGGAIVQQEGEQLHPTLARGSGDRMFLAYQGWTDAVGSRNYSDCRIWGKMNPSPGIADGQKAAAETANPGPRIVRGVLFLPVSSPPSLPASLLDVSGRRVLSLAPGPNDVRSLPPGVYFVCSEPSAAIKVVVTR